jgi:hypothetical protein
MLHRRGIGRRSVVLLAAAVLSLAIAACGSLASSSSNSGQAGSAGAQSLLDATFSGSHAVKSGVLGFNLTLTPSGSSTIKGPISIGLSGPFQSRGSGQLPESDLAISIDALGHHGQLGIVSTGTAGYVTLKGPPISCPRRSIRSWRRASLGPAVAPAAWPSSGSSRCTG